MCSSLEASTPSLHSQLFVVLHRSSSLGGSGLRQGLPQVLCSHDCRLTVVLCEHVFGFLTFAMSSVTDDRQAHGLILSITSDQLLKGGRKFLELFLGGETGFKKAGLDLHLLLMDLKRRTLEVATVLLGAESSVSVIVIGASEAIESASLGKVVLVATLSLVFEVDAHHILKIVTA